MKTMKRLEIVADTVELKSILAAVDAAGAPGYTVIKDVLGKGGRGLRNADDLTDAFKNCLILVACDETVATRLVEAVRPILKRFGGICLVTDAQYVLHES